MRTWPSRPSCRADCETPLDHSRSDTSREGKQTTIFLHSARTISRIFVVEAGGLRRRKAVEIRPAPCHFCAQNAVYIPLPKSLITLGSSCFAFVSLLASPCIRWLPKPPSCFTLASRIDKHCNWRRAGNGCQGSTSVARCRSPTWTKRQGLR